MEKISVIVPVYNVEKYLGKCINSIVNQTYSELEILLIDDGSTDLSGKICDEFAKKDHRITVIHKENGGLSSARNVGIEHATGEYLGFVDSDDYIETDMYEILITNLKTENADLSMCDLIHRYEGKVPKVNTDTEYCIWNSKEAIKVVMEAEKTSVTAVNKLYKKKLFATTRYPLNRLSEDAFVIVELLLQCDKIVFTSEQKYNYIHRKNSITTSTFKLKDLDVIDAYKKNYQLIMNHFPELENVAKMRCLWADFYVLDKWARSEDVTRCEEINQIIIELRHHYIFIMRDPCFHVSRKVAMTLLAINVKLYKLCVILSQKKYID